MSNYPSDIDDDSTLPAVNDNLTEIGGAAINALRDAVVQIETALGTNIAGSSPSLAARLGVFINPDGTPNASVITSLGLVTLPIRNDQIAEAAGIPESKLHLDFRTQDLFNYIRDLSLDVNTTLGWINTTGIKLEPHLIGAIYRHTMDQIDVSNSTSQFLKNNLRLLRDNTQSYTLANDINNELLAHQWADGSPFGPNNHILTNNGSTYSTYFAHVAGGIFINTSRFTHIPQTDDDMQSFAEYVDNNIISQLTTLQNVNSNGISVASRSSTLTEDGYGQFIVPPTPAIAFLKNIGNNAAPFDNIDSGDDIIQFNPSSINQLNSYFDSAFSLVRPGDIIRVLYGDGYNIEVPYVIKEKKYNSTTGNKKYLVRIAGKNQFYSPNAVARIDRPLANINKYGELSISPVNNQFAGTPSLIINNPRAAQALGLGFDSEQFDEKHYLLYLALYPTGFAQDGYTILPAIDVTGNKGKTPGLYTIESVVQATNNAFRAVGYNYRFTAFEFQGEFGICLADSYNNAGFSILNVVIAANGSIDTLSTSINFPNNVVDLLPVGSNTVAPDPLGIGSSGSGVASPPFRFSYFTAAASQQPAKLFVPLRRNNYYVNGSESERLAIENTGNVFTTQALDGYGDGYWLATIANAAVQVGRVQTTYRIFQDLSNTDLKIGKTIVVQSLGAGSLVDFGRYIIQSVTFNCAPNVYTDITVYDSVHAKGFSPSLTVQPFAQVAVYFSSDSVSFNTETATDFVLPTPSGQFKRHFEVYVDNAGKTFTHERGRMSLAASLVTVNDSNLQASTSLNKFDIVTVSPKLRGYQFGTVNKITLNVTSFVSATGIFTGNLASYDGVTFTHLGPTTIGKKGETIRFYDETNTDYIDLVMDPNAILVDFSNQVIDFQLFPTLQLDVELMLLGTCQVNDASQIASKIVDRRQFGNIGEKDLSTSVYNFMSVPEKYLHSNGVIRGFDIFNLFSGSQGIVNLSGGVLLVNGKIIDINNDTISIPIVKELYSSTLYPVDWAVCINDKGEYVTVPLLDTGIVAVSSRTFTASEFVSSTTYNLPAVLFSDLINKRPDLTLLYIINAVVTGTPTSPVITLTSKDARKFIYKKDWGETPTLVADTNIGDFRTFESLASWFNFNSNYNNTVTLKGTFSSFPSSLTYTAGRARFTGDGNTIFNIGSALTATNLEFNNIVFNASISPTFSNVTFNAITYTAPSTNCTFSSCTINNSTFNGTVTQFNFAGCTLNNVVINLQGTSSIVSTSSSSFNNCTINVTNSSNSISISGASSVFRNCTINFNNATNTMTATGNISDNKINYNVISGNTISINGSFIVKGNTFLSNNTGAITQFLSISDGSNGVITANNFFRGSNVVTAYILAPAILNSGVVSIVDNFFDSSTIDGSNQNLVKNLPLSWVYKDNLNQPSTLNNIAATGLVPYNVTVYDNVISLVPSAPMIVNLPAISLSPPGRTLTIKDVNGVFDTNQVTLHRAVNTETIEGIAADYVMLIPYGSITILAGSTGWTII